MAYVCPLLRVVGIFFFSFFFYRLAIIFIAHVELHRSKNQMHFNRERNEENNLEILNLFPGKYQHSFYYYSSILLRSIRSTISLNKIDLLFLKNENSSFISKIFIYLEFCNCIENTCKKGFKERMTRFACIGYFFEKKKKFPL